MVSGIITAWWRRLTVFGRTGLKSVDIGLTLLASLLELRNMLDGVCHSSASGFGVAIMSKDVNQEVSWNDRADVSASWSRSLFHVRAL